MKKVLILSYALIILVSWTTKNIENFVYNELKNQKGQIIHPSIETSLESQINKSQVVENITVESVKKKTVLIKRKQQVNETEDEAQEKQDIVDYLWDKTHNIDLILTFERESGLNKDIKNWNTNGSYDVGICQVNSQYHLNWIKNIKFKDWKNQADYCIDIYNVAIKSKRIYTTFYAYNKRNTVRNRYIITQMAYDIYFNLTK